MQSRYPVTTGRALLAVVLLCMVPRDALAYVDPGSGLLLIQGLLAVIGGVVVFLTNPLAAIKRWWARLFSKSRHRDP